MKFVELRLDGFGKLVDRTFVFAPGLNLIFGPNEAGKSTLQQALLALLYGFYDEGSVTKVKREFAKSLIPWMPGVDFSGSLIYQLDDDRTLRTVRSFSGQPITRLATYPEGQDASFEYRSASHGRLYFADAQLGMGKGVFENTCVVRQAELVALEESAMAITDTLMRLSASASQDTTTADALAMLEKTLRDEIGSDRAWTRPLAKARQRLEELHKAQKETMKSRREVFSLIAELNQEKAQLEALDQDIERLRCLAALAELQKVQTQLDASIQADTEAENLAAEVERWHAWASFPAHLRDEVIRSDGDRSRLIRGIEEYASRMAEIQRSRADLAHRLQAAESEMEALADAKDVPAEQLPQIQRLETRWESARQVEQIARSRFETAEGRLSQIEQRLSEERTVLGKAVGLGLAGLARLQQRWLADQQQMERAQATLQQAWAEWQKTGLSDEQFQALGETIRQSQTGTLVESRPRKGCRFWKRAETPPGPPPELTIYTQVKPIWDKLDAARAEVQSAKDSFAATDAEAKQYMALDPTEKLDQDRFEMVSQRLNQYTRLVSETEVQGQNVADARTEAEEAQVKVEIAQDALTQAFSAMGYRVADLQSAVSAFERACERKEQYDHAHANHQQLCAEDRLLLQEEQAQVQREESLVEDCDFISVALTKAGIEVTVDDLPGAVALFEENYKNHERWCRAQENYEAALVRPASGLRQQEREAARKRITALKQQIEVWQASYPDWRALTTDRDAHDYRTRNQKHERTRQAKQERCTQLRESVQRMTRDLRHPAELSEEIAAVQAQIRRLAYLRDVLTLAKDELEASTEEYQKVFAPRLERIIAEGMARVTQGRYTQVSIDPSTLAVTLVAPERKEPVDAAVLSTGTRDLIYLLLRIGIGRLMSRTGETMPLLLDDPLVQFDRERQEHALQLLASLAEETQIILFTKDDGVFEWFQNELAADVRHHVHTLP